MQNFKDEIKTDAMDVGEKTNNQYIMDKLENL